MSEALAKRAYAIARDNFLFEALSDSELTTLMEAVRVVTFSQGAVIVQEGDRAHELFLVVDGGVNVVKHGGQFLAYLGRGGFFGEMALFSKTARRSADCIATGETVCVVIDASVLENFCDKHPQSGLKICRSIIRVLSERLQATSADLAMLMSTQAQAQADVDKWVAAAKAQRGERP